MIGRLNHVRVVVPDSPRRPLSTAGSLGARVVGAGLLCRRTESPWF